MFTPFSSPHSEVQLNTSSTSVHTNSPLIRQSSQSRNILSRGLSFRERLRRVQDRLVAPFALPTSNHPRDRSASLTDTRSDAIAEATAAEQSAMASHSRHIRDPSQPSYLVKTFRSDKNTDIISLPFQLSVMHAHDKTHRNVPYLRHSWCRIDFVAIISFWISFGLASGGLERGTHHIGIFRAMSVLRTARLLTITSGTTVGAFYLVFRRPRIPIPSSIRPLCTRSRLRVLSLLALPIS
jgi:hypothetical protein